MLQDEDYKKNILESETLKALTKSYPKKIMSYPFIHADISSWFK